MEINSKDELLSVIEDLQSRLAVVEDSTTKQEPEDETSEETHEEHDDKQEVESEDEIEKLLNV